MVTSLDDLIATLTSDAAMVGAVVALYALLRKGLRQMVREEIGTQVTERLHADLSLDGESPRQALIEIRQAQAIATQRDIDLSHQFDLMAGRLAELRGEFIAHAGQDHGRA